MSNGNRTATESSQASCTAEAVHRFSNSTQGRCVKYISQLYILLLRKVKKKKRKPPCSILISQP
jgi:hypothetical protein